MSEKVDIQQSIAKLLGVDVDELNEVEEIIFTSTWGNGEMIETDGSLNTKNGYIFDVEQEDDEDVLAELGAHEGSFITLRSGHSIDVDEDNYEFIDVEDLDKLAKSTSITSPSM